MKKANDYITFLRKLQSYKMINHIELLIKDAKCKYPCPQKVYHTPKRIKECKALY